MGRNRARRAIDTKISLLAAIVARSLLPEALALAVALQEPAAHRRGDSLLTAQSSAMNTKADHRQAGTSSPWRLSQTRRSNAPLFLNFCKLLRRHVRFGRRRSEISNDGDKSARAEKLRWATTTIGLSVITLLAALHTAFLWRQASRGMPRTVQDRRTMSFRSKMNWPKQRS